MKEMRRAEEDHHRNISPVRIGFMGVGLVLSCLIPFLVVPLFGFEFSSAIWPAVVLALAASLAASANILNQGLRGAGRPHAGLVSQLLGTGVMALAALFFLRRFGLMGMAFAVLMSACAQLLVLVAAAAKWLEDLADPILAVWRGKCRLIFQQLAACGCEIRDPGVILL